MKRRPRCLFVIASLGIGLTLALVWMLSWAPATTRAQPAAGIIRVATTGSNLPTCGSVATPCLTIQYAVDQAVSGDEIQVAAGTYTGVSMRPSPYGPGLISQMVYITKTLTVRGGYTTTNDFAGPPDPVKNPTTLDAQRQGRVFVLFGTIQPTIEGFRITGGDATGQGGAPSGDGAGGIGIILAEATIRYCDIFSNTAQFAGGVGLGNSAATLSWNTIRENSAHSGMGGGGEGGGVGLSESPATLIGNTIISNTAEGDGGGLVSTGSDGVTMLGNKFISNSTTAGGGGLYMDTTTATLTSNTIFANRAIEPVPSEGGAGIYLWSSNVVLSGTTIVSNTTNADGGGLYLGGDGLPGSQVTLQNCVVADNQADRYGSGIYVERSAAVLQHVTLARNVGLGSENSGIYLNEYSGGSSTAALTNTILVSHTVGIFVDTSCTITLESTLWATGTIWANGIPWENYGDLTHDNDFPGPPDFLDPDEHDYHINAGSAAIDKGQDAGVEIDIDNEPRPAGTGYDLGADEYFYPVIEVTKEVWPDQVQPGSQLTYTIHVVNNGNVALNATITDTLPPHVVPGGEVIWTPVIPVSDTWQETVVVTVAADYYGVLTNTVDVTTDEGVTGTDIVTSVSCTPLTGVDFNWEPIPARQGESTLFNAWVTPSIPADYTWDLGGLVLLSGNPVSYTFPVSDTYSVEVIAADACGGSVSATKPVLVVRRFEQYLPVVLRGLQPVSR